MDRKSFDEFMNSGHSIYLMLPFVALWSAALFFEGGVLYYVCLGIAAVGFTLRQTSGWKDRLLAVLLCLFFASFSSFDGVYLLNGALDSSFPVSRQVKIEKKWTDRGYKGQTSYYVRTVRGDGTKEEFSVFETEYERVEKGDTIKIEEYAGAFGIPYKKAVIPEEKDN